jgi:diacylglycerol O-acyltransferase / wax synthase
MRFERLSPEDAGILALESGTVRGHTCKVVVVGGRHEADDVRAHLERRIGLVPRLRQRLAPTPLRLAPPAWVDDPSFTLERHVRGRSIRAGLDEAALRRRVGELMTERLNPDRPLWAMDVLGLAGDRTALVWRLHHCMADGMTAMSMARRLLFDEAPAGSRPEWTAAPMPGPVELLVDGLRARLAAGWRGAAAAGDAVASPGAWPAVARSVARLPGVLRREVVHSGDSSPLDRPAGTHRDTAFVTAPLDELKAIGHAAPERATVNDVVLAAVAGGLRGWLEQLGASEQGLRVKVPVSLHRPGDGSANRDSFMVVDLPLADPDPLSRLVAIAKQTQERKRQRDAETLDAFFRDLSHLSRSLERHAEHWAMSPRVFTLNVSNVPGPQGPLRVLGSPLEALHSLAEIAHRHALRVAVVSAAGRISFGLCADAEAVDRLDLVAAGIEQELAELQEAIAGRRGQGETV